MTKKIIFIDVDGTLVDEHDHVPKSAEQAIQAARKAGHRVYLCTGRSKAEIFPNIVAVGFDGLIGAGGGYVESDGEVVFHQQISQDSVRKIVSFFQENEMNFYLESNGGLYGNEGLLAQLHSILPPSADNQEHPFIKKLHLSDALLDRDDVNKICFLENKQVPFAKIADAFGDEFELIHCTVPMFGKDSGELTVPGVDKGVAIRTLLDYLGASVEQTIGIGDGLNDIEMFNACAVGIAMGNGQAGLKEVADYVTASVTEDGLYQAFQAYHLI